MTWTGEERLQAPVSQYKGVKNNKVHEYTTIGKIIQDQQDPTGPYYASTIKARKAHAIDSKAYSKIKENQPGMVIGKYPFRNDNSCEQYIPLLGLDIDGIKEDFIVDFMIDDLRKNPFIFRAAPSMSGHGIRVLIWTNATLETHKEVYLETAQSLAEFLKIPLKKTPNDKGYVDTSTKNVSRLWFLNYDKPERIHFNLDSQVFYVKPDQISKKRNFRANEKKELTEEQIIEFVRERAKERNIPPGRNNFVFFIAQLYYEHNLSEERIYLECSKFAESDFDINEINTTVRKAIANTSRKYSHQQILKYIVERQKSNPAKDPLPAQAPKPDPSKEKASSGKQPKFVLIRKFLTGKYDLRCNIIANELEYKLKSDKGYRKLNEYNLITELLELGFNGVESLVTVFLKSDYVKKFDPFLNYMEKLPLWDGHDHIEDLANFVVAKDQDWWNTQLKKMLVRTVACALNKIPFNKHCFILKSNQNNGKTTFLRFLCPPELQLYFKDNFEPSTKDGKLCLCQNLFINLDELATLSKYEINKIKALFTLDKVKERLPYDKTPTNLPRRASFVGSTNNDEFLNDETGSVRYLVHEILEIIHDNGGPKGYNANIDIDLVYSQAYHLLKSGFNFKLTKEEIKKSERNNRKFYQSPLEEELIMQHFIPGSKAENDEFLMTSQIMEVIQLGVKNNLSKSKVGRALRHLGYEKGSKHISEYNQSRTGYFVKRISEE